jgi:hypothetical protein
MFRRLSSNQYACLFGALSFGIAMFVGFAVDDYLQGMVGNPAVRPSFAQMAIDLVSGLLAGCAFGWMMWGGNRQASPSVK